MIRLGAFFLALTGAGCAAPADATSTGPQVPLDLWPRVLAHVAAEELRAPERRCEGQGLDPAWMELSETLRPQDRALRGGPPVETGAGPA